MALRTVFQTRRQARGPESESESRTPMDRNWFLDTGCWLLSLVTGCRPREVLPSYTDTHAHPVRPDCQPHLSQPQITIAPSPQQAGWRNP